MQFEKDKKGNEYCEIDNIRITLVKSKTRKANSILPKKDAIRIQSYQSVENYRLNRGAEIAIQNEATIDKLINLLKQFK